jgi:dTDP-glucose 4,6-dehydratase
VEDHCRAIFAALEKGRPGQVYNVGGNCSLPNLDVVRRILKAAGKPESLMTYVADRPGHDRRYALTNEKLTRETGWRPEVDFDEGLAATIRWYHENQDWVARVKSGEYQRFYEINYKNRC